MIRGYQNKITQEFAQNGKHKKIPNQIWQRAMMRLIQLDNATIIDDLRIPFSNKLEALTGDRLGQYSIRINQQWRICFHFENGNAHGVEIVDYH